MPSIDLRSLLLFSAVLRLLLILYGEWQDTHMEVRHTDVDYLVFSDAASLMASGKSPYERTTYRYGILCCLRSFTSLEGGKHRRIKGIIHVIACSTIQISTVDKDKEFFEDKLLSSALAIDNLHDQMKTLSLKLESSEETVRNGKLFMSIICNGAACGGMPLAEERIRRLESEAEIVLSRKSDMEFLLNKTLSESSRFESNMQDLLLKISALESESKDSTEKQQEEIQKKSEEVERLQEVDKHEQHRDSLEKKVGQLQTILEEKEQLVLRSKDREKEFEDQKTEDSMLESKQLELSRHLKELSQRNDQAINDIRRKFEVEKPLRKKRFGHNPCHLLRLLVVNNLVDVNDLMKYFREDLHRRLLSTDLKMQVLEFLPELYDMLRIDWYTLTEREAAIFLPCLVEKYRTWTTPKCLKSIKEHAFAASPYPVIITLADHLTPDLQAKEAQFQGKRISMKIYGERNYQTQQLIKKMIRCWFKQPAILKTAIVKDADRNSVSCLANKVAKTFDFSIGGASSRSCKYVLNTLMQIFQYQRRCCEEEYP
ncbi:hypothetical protein RHMOL_Rhmol09G0117200 [Rhododendron molle]|uniref:Uncharacterized protein n=1 Tax=Rhododendron molle TaxID=49168 RepID=A0ACC0MDN0_RHOML|nr:hypothetical protein RHMOL_Rhmol09G0117200 [Rhododendron molle]